MLHKLAVAGIVVGLLGSTTAVRASPPPVPLVITSVDNAAGSHALEQVKDGDKASGGKKWFSFWFPENLKAQIEEKKWLLLLVGFVFSPVFGAIWSPMVLLGVPFDMEWALPSIIYTVIADVLLCTIVVGWFPWIGWLFYVAMLASSTLLEWISVQTMIANINRPEVPLHK
jgi:hypothetical protein